MTAGRTDLVRQASRPAPPSDDDVRPAARRSALVAQAQEVSRRLLRRLPDGGRRWRHTEAVAARARQAGPILGPHDADLLEAAAWLHDIGYAPALAHSGFHPVDGATYVQEHLHHATIAGLVAHHSGARFVASVRGLGDLMRPFALPRFWTGPVADALTWADQTTGPDGLAVTVEQRLQDTLDRQGPDSPNARARAQREPAIIAAVRATDARLTAAAAAA